MLKRSVRLKDLKALTDGVAKVSILARPGINLTTLAKDALAYDRATYSVAASALVFYDLSLWHPFDLRQLFKLGLDV